MYYICIDIILLYFNTILNIIIINICLSMNWYIKNYLYKGLLRFRWHHTSDIFFVAYDIMVLFAVA